MTGPPERFYVHYIGGRLYADVRRFIREAKRLGVARAIPKPFLAKLQWGDTILLGQWKVHEDAKEQKAQRPGTATIFGYFHLNGINIAASEYARFKIMSQLTIEKTESKPVRIERECGAYEIVAVSHARDSLNRIVRLAIELEEQIGEKIRLFMTGAFCRIEPSITLDPIGFTRTLTVAFIQTEQYAPFQEPPELREITWVMDYAQRRYIKKADRDRLDAATGGVAGSVTP